MIIIQTKMNLNSYDANISIQINADSEDQSNTNFNNKLYKMITKLRFLICLLCLFFSLGMVKTQVTIDSAEQPNLGALPDIKEEQKTMELPTRNEGCYYHE